MSEPRYSIVVMDNDRRRRQPLAQHTGLSATDAFELAAVCRALGHRGEDVVIEREGTKRKELAS